MKKKILFIASLLLVFCILFTGCNPENRSTIKKHLNEALNIEYEYISTTTEKNDDGYKVNIYYYKDVNGVEFHVKSGYYRTSLGIPDRSTSCNYIDILMGNANQVLNEALGSDFTWENKYGNDYAIYVKNYDELPAVASCIAKAYNVIGPFPVNRDKYVKNLTYGHPNALPHIGVYRQEEDIFICDLFFPCVGEDAYTEHDILEELRYEYVDRVKRDFFDEDIPDEILYNYPASEIRNVYCNGLPLYFMELQHEYSFEYEKTLQEYICGLDPCVTYDNTDETRFRNLVESLGGTYECSNWKASWKIGENNWDATLVLDKKRKFKDLTIFKNNEKINLSTMSKSNGTVWGRAFTISDLELMLNVSVNVNQKEQTIELVKN